MARNFHLRVSITTDIFHLRVSIATAVLNLYFGSFFVKCQPKSKVIPISVVNVL